MSFFSVLRSKLPRLHTQATGPSEIVLEQVRAQRRMYPAGLPPMPAFPAGPMALPQAERTIVDLPRPTRGASLIPTAANAALPAQLTPFLPVEFPDSSSSSSPQQLKQLSPAASRPRPPIDELDEDATTDASLTDLEQQTLLPPGSHSNMRFQSSPTGSDGELVNIDGLWSIWCNNGDCCGIVCVVFTWFLLLWPAWMMYSRVLGPWTSMWSSEDEDAETKYTGIGLMLLYIFFAVSALISHTKAMCTDPGSIPYGCLPIVPPPAETGLYPSCVHCAYNYKPPRAHHCSTQCWEPQEP